MVVHCKFFAGLRQKVGAKEKTLELPQDATVADALAAVGLNRENSYILLRNGIHAEKRDRLADGDVLSIFPPIAGG